MVTNTELDPLVGQYQHESLRPRAEQALFTLQKIASMVKPIMRRRGWRVGMLAEFYPSQGNLLGLNTNRGQIINLRLRYPGDQNQFLPIEDVLDTMLHELCHNEIGPHNQQFHALWDQLRDEHEALLRKGYSGEGFLGRGDRLGGQRIPVQEAKRRARAAAERRRTLTAGSGQRLGGHGILRGQDARAVIVAAIDRRLRVERGCASGTDTGRQVASDEAIKKEEVTTTRAEQEDQNETIMMQAFIDLIEEEESAAFGAGYQPPSADNPAGPRGHLRDNPKGQSLVAQQREIESNILKERQKNNPGHDTLSPPPSSKSLQEMQRPDIQAQPTLDSETWTCEICTLVNPMNFLTCDACTVERPMRYSTPAPPSPPPVPTSTRPKRPAPPSSSSIANETRHERPNALKPRLSSAQAYEKFERERADKVASKPVGWTCSRCRKFMEQEWWTCSSCGTMKSSS